MFLGIDNRKYLDGMFRLNENGEYIDNQSFERDEQVRTLALEEVQTMITESKIPADLSARVDMAIKEGLKMPKYIQYIIEGADKIKEGRGSEER